MGSRSVLVALASTMLALSVSTAFGQKIDPRCANMRDKIGCTCALENGGHITPQGTWTANAPGRGGTNRGRHLNEEFYNCNIRYKGKNG